ncbi:MAG TPA: glutaredoxin family protein [Burkholderiales bacterium]|nr:glutaredoxin family protein [Burkholderiales bacterium]
MITGMIAARVIAVVALSFALGAHAQVYRWLDEKGRLHAGDTPPPSARDVEKVRVAPTPTEPVEPYALQVARKNNPVTLYSTRNCPLCDRARELLKARGVPFSEKSVVTDQQVEELERVVGRNAVPSLVVGTKIQDGFADSLYEAMLDGAGYPKKGALPARKQEPAAAAQPPLGPYAPRAK